MFGMNTLLNVRLKYTLKLDPTDNYPDYSTENLIETMGLVKQWAHEYAELHPKDSGVSLKDFVLDCYGMHMGEFNGTCKDFVYKSPHDEDEDLHAFVEFKYGDQSLTMYPYSIVHFGKENYITRMD